MSSLNQVVSKIVPTHRGDFVISDQYNELDEVFYLGDTYRVNWKAVPPIGTLPTDTDYWKKTASKGDTFTVEEVTATDNEDGTFDLKFKLTDESEKTVTTPDLTGPVGPYINDITSEDNEDGTFDLTFSFTATQSPLTVTTPDLTGPPPELVVGTVTTVGPSDPADFKLTENTPNVWTIDVDIPQGLTGDGDVSKPVSAVEENEIVLFGNTLGDLLKSSGKTLSDYADADHNHDGVYSPINHNHDSSYAPLNYFETGILKIEHIPAAVFQAPIVSSGGIADLDSGQQTSILEGTHVVTTDGKAWIYKGSGSKTSTDSYIELADKTPEWSVIASKPTTLSGYGITDGASSTDLSSHTSDTNNPHSVTKAQVGLTNVSNDAQLKIASNLGDLNNASTARTNLGAAASGSVTSSGLTMATARILGRTTASVGSIEELTIGNGLSLASSNLTIDKASAANIWSGASNKIITADSITSASALTTPSGSSNFAPDWSAFIVADWNVDNNRTLSNPTNVIVGTTRYVFVRASSGTRTISFGSNYKGDLPTLNDVTDAKWYLLSLVAYSSTHIVVSAVEASS